MNRILGQHRLVSATVGPGLATFGMRLAQLLGGFDDVWDVFGGIFCGLGRLCGRSDQKWGRFGRVEFGLIYVLSGQRYCDQVTVVFDHICSLGMVERACKRASHEDSPNISLD